MIERADLFTGFIGFAGFNTSANYYYIYQTQTFRSIPRNVIYTVEIKPKSSILNLLSLDPRQIHEIDYCLKKGFHPINPNNR